MFVQSLRNRKSRPRQLGTKVLPGTFKGYALNTGGGWPGDLTIAGWRDIENHVASEVDVKRFKNLRCRNQDIAESVHISLRKGSQRRRSRTTSNLAPPQSQELRRGRSALTVGIKSRKQKWNKTMHDFQERKIILDTDFTVTLCVFSFF